VMAIAERVVEPSKSVVHNDFIAVGLIVGNLPKAPDLMNIGTGLRF
jgi:hypothetical protein